VPCDLIGVVDNEDGARAIMPGFVAGGSLLEIPQCLEKSIALRGVVWAEIDQYVAQ